MNYNFSELKKKLEAIKEHFQNEIASLRTGRATPELVSKILIECYDSKTPLEQLSSISIENAKTIRIQPWDKNVVLNIERGIENSNLGLRPVVDKETLRVTLPDLTSERRNDLLKMLKDKLEDAKIMARRDRDDVWRDIQERERRKEMAEDDKFRFKDEMQKIIDEANSALEEVANKKEREIMI